MNKKVKIMSKKRIVIILVASCFLFFALTARTAYLQLIKGDWLSTKAIDQQTREVPIPAKRGTIYDANMKELAVSATKYTIWCKPVEVTDKDEASKSLSVILEKEVSEVEALVGRRDMALVKIERWVSDDIAQQVREAKIPGIWVAEDNQRYYPYGNFAPYVIGHTSDDSQGIAGVEMQYNDKLQGTDGKLIISTDASGREIPHGMEQYFEPTQGNGVVLTIDEVIQHYTEKAAQKAYEINNAKRITIVTIDPKTGDVLSMASKPDYDPNNPREPIYPYFVDELANYDDGDKLNGYYQMWRNPAVSDTYEPGSTFKLITSASGIEENVIQDDEVFTCTGSVTIAGRKIKCWRHYEPHGEQSFAEGVQNSCNPVFIEVGNRLGVSKFYDYIEGFGFMEKSGIDLPGEGKGILHNEKNVGPVELATISFGQSNSTTPMQLISGIGAIANDGKLMQPRVVKAYTDDKGNVIEEIDPIVKRQVVSEETADKVMEIAESVVRDGSGHAAYIPGYKIGGKTGTAQKVIDGRYAQGKYICSFVGVAPTDNPQIVVLAIVDEPTGVAAFGSTTAGPIVKEVLQDTLKYLGVEEKYTEEEKEEFEKLQVVVPNVVGMNIGDATKALEEHNLKINIDTDIEMDENTVIKDMFPKSGIKVSEGSSVILYFE